MHGGKGDRQQRRKNENEGGNKGTKEKANETSVPGMNPKA